MDLDDATHFDHCLRLAQSPVTRNFVLDFSDSASWVSFDLSTSNVEALVQAERPQALRTRWINIWHPEHHGPMLEVLAKRYDFSPRLLVLMSSDPRNDGNAASNLPIIGGAKRRRNLWKRRSPAAVPNSDLEKGTNELMEDASILSYDSVAQSNLYTIVRDLWHYSSMDFGRNYICMGYNSLYGTKGEAAGAGHGPLPHCVRLWTWLVLCQDGTVISINESPFPFSEGRLDDFQHKVVMETRRNLVNVFRSLSLANTGSMLAQRPMSALPIRARLGETLEETIHRDTDAPGLLFYYLFENWHNTYTLITRRESRYGVELEELRTEMIQAPELRHIDRLDSIGKELGVIRRHFDSYDRMIDRLLEPRGATTASLQNSRVVSESSQATLDTVRPLITQTDSMLGVSLSSASQVRFRRLKDLIDLYALSEVEEYIKQKDALVTMVSRTDISRHVHRSELILTPHCRTSTSSRSLKHATWRNSPALRCC